MYPIGITLFLAILSRRAFYDSLGRWRQKMIDAEYVVEENVENFDEEAAKKAEKDVPVKGTGRRRGMVNARGGRERREGEALIEVIEDAVVEGIEGVEGVQRQGSGELEEEEGVGQGGEVNVAQDSRGLGMGEWAGGHEWEDVE
jgi:hypothetical protein